MADEQQRNGGNGRSAGRGGGIGRLFARAQERRRERKAREARHEEQQRRRAAPSGSGSGEDRAFDVLHEHRVRDQERSRFGARGGGFAYRETGGGYGGYGGAADRGLFAPDQGRFGAGFSGYGPGGREAGGFPTTWRGGEFRGGRQHWRGAEFRGGGGETWRGRSGSAASRGSMSLGTRGPWDRDFEGGRRRSSREEMGVEDDSHPHGLGDWGQESARMERGPRGGSGYAARSADRPHGLGSGFDEDEWAYRMEHGTHPGHPGMDTVEPLGGSAGGYGGALHGGGRHGDREEEELRAERVGPGAFRRAGGGGGIRIWRREEGWARSSGAGGYGRESEFLRRWDREEENDRVFRSNEGQEGVGAHRGRRWEGPSDAARTGAWFGGGREQRPGWTGSGPDSERSSEWIGGPAGTSRESVWYGGGVREAREDRVGQDFGELGGPRHGRYGREETPGRGGGRGFGGPLGRYGDRDRGEQGALYTGAYRGREDEYPVRGEAIAGRGHVGSDDYRELTRYGEGRGDRGAHERFRERSEEGDHFRGP